MSVEEVTIFENEQVVRAFVDVRTELYVLNQNLDKTDQLALRADLKGIQANLTINIAESETNSIFFQINELEANEIDVTYTSFGNINADFIKECLNTLMWQNAAGHKLVN